MKPLVAKAWLQIKRCAWKAFRWIDVWCGAEPATRLTDKWLDGGLFTRWYGERAEAFFCDRNLITGLTEAQSALRDGYWIAKMRPFLEGIARDKRGAQYNKYITLYDSQRIHEAEASLYHLEKAMKGA